MTGSLFRKRQAWQSLIIMYVMNKTLKVIIGPTGIGKTEYALQMAEQYGCPILNADSRQIYKDIPIGTAAPTAEEMKRVHHYFVGTLSLDEYYSAAQYEQDAMKLLNDLFRTHDTVVMSGGSMMYIDAVCKGIDDIPTVDDETRALLKQRYEMEGLEPLVRELRLLDPQYYDECDKRNPKRVVHALEICYMTGCPFSSFRVRKQVQRPFVIEKIGLQRPRPILFDRINHRVDVMVQQGLIEEAKRVLPYRQYNSLNTVGYKELFRYFDGEWTLDFALDKIRRNSRVYAKKQMTWFKKDEDVKWVELGE